jgi:nicotinamidase-related amidase
LSENTDLHGNAPDSSPYAMLIIDMINDFEFPGGESLIEHALPAANRIANLKQALKARGVPIIYVNDNFGKWRSDFREQVRHCLEDGVRGEPVARLLKPEPEDYFVLKPKHSAFYATPLELLLEHLQTQKLFITGVAGNSCVLFSANEAYVRDYELIIPRDCVASMSTKQNDRCLEHMREDLKADTLLSNELIQRFIGG